jgi:hypothetical protein
MRAAFVSVVLVCATIPAMGQRQSGMLSMSESEKASLGKPVAIACPVNLHLRTSPVPNILETSKGRHVRRTQQIEIALSNFGTKDVTAFDAHVVGFSERGELQLLTAQYPDGEPSASASIHVDETVIAGGNRSLTRTVKNIIGVKWLQLDTITFRDGSTWERSSATACRVQPDPFLLVAQH